MKIYSSITFDIATGEILDSVSEEYRGPLALCGDAGLGDFGGTAIADATGDGGEGADLPADEPASDTDIIGEVGTDEPVGDEPADIDPVEGAEPQAAATDKGKDILPAQLSKAIRELKSAHSDNPETLRALSELNKAFYTAKDYKQLGSVDELRTQRAALESVGGAEGIAQMRSEISGMEKFDRLASEGDPAVIRTLAEEFPDGFKRLVAPTLQKLEAMDPASYRETMRGPLLQMLEGDGLISYIGHALESIKAAEQEPDHASIRYRDAKDYLSSITQWYQGLKQQEQEVKARYQDPRLQQVQQREEAAAQREINIYKSTVRRDLGSYLSDTMRPEVTRILSGKQIQSGGRARFEENVQAEIFKTLKANADYVTTVNALSAKGDTDGAVRYAKPFIDAARKSAIPKVFTDLYGAAAPVRRPAPPATRTPPNGTQRQVAATDKPIPVRSQPAHDDIDWNKTPNMMFITNKAVLKGSGKLVTWGNTIQR